MQSHEILKNILAECREDYVGLWSIVRQVKESQEDKSTVFKTTISLIDKLLREKDIIAGTFEGKLFTAWDLTEDKALSKIETEWQELGRDPNLGEIVWFTFRE